MRLSKLQWQILDLALVEYEKPALIQCPFTFGEYHDPGGYERAHSRTITVKQLVKLLYNVELGGYLLALVGKRCALACARRSVRRSTKRRKVSPEFKT